MARTRVIVGAETVGISTPFSRVKLSHTSLGSPVELILPIVSTLSTVPLATSRPMLGFTASIWSSIHLSEAGKAYAVHPLSQQMLKDSAACLNTDGALTGPVRKQRSTASNWCGGRARSG